MVVEDTLKTLVERRSVRAVAQVGSAGTPLAWAGSLPQLLVVDRKVQTPTREMQDGMVLHLFPYAALEEGQLPVALLAEARIVYDPTRLLTRQASHLPAADPKTLQKSARALLDRIQLNRQPDFIQALFVARQVFLENVLPMHLSPAQHFVSDCRFPEYLQNRLSLTQPRVLSALNELFALRHPEEASLLLAATRGLSLTQQEKRARIANEAGFAQGSIFYLRQESTRIHQEALKQWAHLPAPRRERLSQLWGLERSPLGWVAVNLVREFL
ncbi:hypothetical protein [Deinococcus roseus]|uniref:AraC family transcriptional regulator n=1 Tax=Deinococcus roseus TaxID=392414 RepID=A0ABQ2D115_9DEIO|nr:hypothetical protein [Deinococcus roseus]GGJ40364.1 hypothetical protein GCM10008938_28040 [Deinococcus roseus]